MSKKVAESWVVTLAIAEQDYVRKARHSYFRGVFEKVAIIESFCGDVCWKTVGNYPHLMPDSPRGGNLAPDIHQAMLAADAELLADGWFLKPQPSRRMKSNPECPYCRSVYTPGSLFAHSPGLDWWGAQEVTCLECGLNFTFKREVRYTSYQG